MIELGEADWQAEVAALDLAGAIDDIILLDPRHSAAVEAAARLLAPEGTLTLVGDHPLDRPAMLDVGRIHYEFIAYLGCPGPQIDAAFGPSRNRSELRPTGWRGSPAQAGRWGACMCSGRCNWQTVHAPWSPPIAAPRAWRSCSTALRPLAQAHGKTVLCPQPRGRAAAARRPVRRTMRRAAALTTSSSSPPTWR